MSARQRVVVGVTGVGRLLLLSVLWILLLLPAIVVKHDSTVAPFRLADVNA